MQALQDKDLIKHYWLTNGVEKLIVCTMATVVIGLFTFSSIKEAMSIPGLVMVELAILAVGAGLGALYFYFNYRTYVNFVSGAEINVTGGKDFLKSLSDSFWDGKSTASITAKIEVPQETQAEVRKAITEFVSDFVRRGSEKFPLHFSAKGWEVKAEVTVGKASNFLLGGLIDNLTAIHSQFPRAAITLTISASSGTSITSTREESADETWAEARWRHDMERHSHDRDMGGDHSHLH